jgi:hypothetical protein
MHAEAAGRGSVGRTILVIEEHPYCGRHRGTAPTRPWG